MLRCVLYQVKALFRGHQGSPFAECLGFAKPRGFSPLCCCWWILYLSVVNTDCCFEDNSGCLSTKIGQYCLFDLKDFEHSFIRLFQHDWGKSLTNGGIAPSRQCKDLLGWSTYLEPTDNELLSGSTPHVQAVLWICT